MKVLKEWTIPLPWGKLALVSWGDPRGDPILLIHGRQDSVATYIPLLELLPDNYYYVGYDMPGHGKSDAFPIGVKLSRLHFTPVIEYVAKHLGWTTFTCMAHSMGGEQAMFYNAINPGQIKKLILLDVGLSLQRLQMVPMNEYYKSFYDAHYVDYHKQITERKAYSKEEALKAVVKARGVNREQAEIILSRNLIQIGDDRFVLSWDNRLKLLAPSNYPKEYYYELFSRNSPPTLLLRATEERGSSEDRIQAVKEILTKMEENCGNFLIVSVTGGHDVHLTNPERCAKHISEFLDKDFGKSKL